MSRDILLSLIDADPAQPRKHFDGEKVAELAESMQGNGLIVPIMVRPVGDRFVIVHGERRYRAAKSLGWAAIPADVRELDTESARWVALVENIQRSDLSPIEEANAYKNMLDTGITQTELGKRIGKGQSYIAQKLRLLTLPVVVQDAVMTRTISEGHARQLLKIKTPDLQISYCQRAINEKLSVAALCEVIDKIQWFTTMEDASDFIKEKLGELDKIWAMLPVEVLFTPAQFKQIMCEDLPDEIANVLMYLYTERYYNPRVCHVT